MPETFQRALSVDPPLLMLDGAEHLLPGAGTVVADLLAASPALQIVVTSRAPLRVPGEHEVALGPLAIPDLRALPSADRLAEVAAVELFVRRCRQVQHDFAVTDQNARAVAEVCVRLDGLPLALELAAVRAKVLTPAQVLDRLRDRFTLLVVPGRAGPDRHQALSSTLRWSHDLLDAGQRLLLRRLAVFRGRWNLAAAEAVCNGDGLCEDDVLVALHGLVDHSLVQTQQCGDEYRYRLLETVREFAAAALADAGEGPAVQRRHRAWFLDVARAAGPALPGAHEAALLNALELDHDDLRAALDSVPADEVGAALEAAAGLSFFWDVRGFLGEGRARLEGLMAVRPPGVDPAVEAAALDALGRLAMAQADHAAADEALRSSIALSIRCGALGRAAWSLSSLAISAFRQGRPQATIRLAGQAARLAGRSGDELAIGRALAARALGASASGDGAEAAVLLEQSSEVGRRWGSDWVESKTAHFAGWQAFLDGECERSAQLQRRSVRAAHALRDRRTMADALDVLALVHFERKDLSSAVSHLVAADGLRADAGCTRPAYLRGPCGAVRASTDGCRGVGSAAAALSSGGSRDLDAVAHLAATSSCGPRPSAVPPLTPREQEIAVLVSHGHRTSDIARRLSISERTVERHLENLRRKLGARSRTQVAAWVVRAGLA